MAGRGETLTVGVVLVTEECCACGVLFAFPSELQDQLRRKPGPAGKQFYCPNGHPQHYLGKSMEQKLREAEQARANAEEEARIAWAEAQQAKAEIKRQAKRASAGVCTCCHRTFQNVARHMATQHPDAVAATKTPAPKAKRR